MVCAIAIAGACNRPENLTPEQARERGDTLLRQMSTSLASLQTFSYSANEERERVRPDGSKDKVTSSRQVTIRRPNGFTFTSHGSERDAAGWYDGKSLTLVSNRDKAWARGPMPPTLDEALDFVSAEYALQLPTADLVYSSPYDALMTKDTTGGWVGVEKIGDTSCDHLAYQQPIVDWEIWLRQDDRKLPRQFEVKYKTQPGQPVTRIVFADFNPTPQVSEDTFKAKVPDGYERLKIMRHATVEDKTAAAAAPAATPTSAAQPR
jgi:hypothetical protein